MTKLQKSGVNARAFEKNSPLSRLFNTAAFGALGILGAGSGIIPLTAPAHAACSTVGTVATCTGNEVDGIQSGTDFLVPPVTTLNVNNLNAPGIAPAATVDGINFTATTAQDITINVDTSGTNGIVTNGNDARGIEAFQTVGNGNVNITHTGNIQASGLAADGISARIFNFSGNVSVTHNGKIETMGSNSNGIAADNSGAGDGNITINSMGNISTNNNTSNGISALKSGAGAGSVSVESVGDINTGAGTSNGIVAFRSGSGAGDVSISSRGDINTTGTVSHGLQVFRSNAGNGNVSITSIGNVSTTGNVSHGIEAFTNGSGNGNATVNSIGNITTSGSDSNGLSAFKVGVGTGDVSVISKGDILTTGTNSEGINAFRRDGNGDVFVSSIGTVASAQSNGIFVDLDTIGSIQVINAGSVSGVTGILVDTRNLNAATTVTNSGTITGTGGTAINFQANGNDTLNLLGGSVIVGNIDFGNGNDGMGGTNANDIDTLNVGPGVNAVLNFVDAGGPGQGNTNLQSAPEIINAPASVLINGGTTLVAVDPTRFAADGAPLGSLTRTIFNGIDNAGSGPDSGTSTHGDGGTGTMAFGSEPSYWGSVFGGAETRDGSASLAGLDHGFGGVMTGIESGFGNGTFGVLGGYSKHNINNEFGTSGLNVESIFGGVYWKQSYDMAQLNLALIGGANNHEGSRNTGAGIARSDYDGWFISPSATLSTALDMLDQPLIASARISYAGLFLDDYTETGGAVPLVIDDRDIHLFNSRLQVMAPNTFSNDDGSHTHVEVRGGVDLQFDAGSGDVNAIAAGTAFNFSADLDDEVAGFVGASVTHTFADERFSLTASTELQTNFSGDVSAFGQVKAAMRF